MSARLYVKQCVNDSDLFNSFAFLMVQGMDEIGPMLNQFEADIANESRRNEEERAELLRFSQHLAKQLQNININTNEALKQNLQCTRDIWYKNNLYPLPENKHIKTLEDLPALNQIINNHFKFYLKPEMEKEIKFFSVNCYFRPMLIRQDGLSLIAITSLSTKEALIEPPNHGGTGICLKTCPYDSQERTTQYMPLCLAVLDEYNIYKIEEEISWISTPNSSFGNKWCWEMEQDYNLLRDELSKEERDDFKVSTVQLYIEGDESW